MSDLDLVTTTRVISPAVRSPRFSYGTLFMGASPLHSSWSQETSDFDVDPLNQKGMIPGRKLEARHYQRIEHVPWGQLWKRNKPEVLVLRVVEDRNLMSVLDKKFLSDPQRPKVIVSLWDTQTSTQSNLQALRSFEKFLRARSYGTVVHHLEASACGSACWGTYFYAFHWDQRRITPRESTLLHGLRGSHLPPRGFANCLTPIGLFRGKNIRWSPPLTGGGKDPNHVGWYRNLPVYHPEGPMPPRATFYVQTGPESIRRISGDEILRVKGLPPEWQPTKRALAGIASSPGAAEWGQVGEYLAHLLAGTCPLDSTLDPELRPLSPGVHRLPPDVTPELLPEDATLPQWTWEPPDMTLGSPFYNQRMSRLREVVAICQGPISWVKEGEAILDKHRQNYGPEGPTHLVVLWWEWPPEHWTALREGSSMNFLLTPEGGITKNSPMTPEQLETAILFVDELIRLGVLWEQDPSDIRKNMPLFLVPKPGQEGQWRCIADGKAGGQNEVCVNDPMHLLQPMDVLPRLYPGGFSAIVDASKYFHMFKTRTGEWKYLGVIHPGTGKYYVYTTLPMGSRNSPAAACRFGAGFLREVVNTDPSFQGRQLQNDFTITLLGGEVDPRYGTGRVNIGSDGLGCNLLFMHIDDVFVHGPTYEKTARGLTHVMNTSHRLGLICQPVKTKPPRQWQKYCGFIYDTREIPTLRVPLGKYTRAKALVAYLRCHQHAKLSRLAIASVAGVLQSLVASTPGNVGNNYLQHLYRVIHDGMPSGLMGTRAAYFDPTTLTVPALEELDWWERNLGGAMCKKARPDDSSVLGVLWGDGSGTGSGGTLELCSGNSFDDFQEMWQGVWNTLTSRQASSNWKELRTLVEFFRRETRAPKNRFYRRRVLYFTDNMVTYDVCRRGTSRSPGLHRLIRELRLLENYLGCILSVIHVPGTEMIHQGSDGLSRGQWINPLNHDPLWDFRGLFLPVVPSLHLMSWGLELVQGQSTRADELGGLQDYPWRFVGDEDPWDAQSLINQFCFWTVSPSLARQAMTQASLAWCESPFTSAHIFIIPRIFQREYGRVNKYFEFLGQHDDPLGPTSPSSHSLPLLVFALCPHKHRLSDLPSRVDPPPPFREPPWVAAQMAALHGMSET